MGPQTQKSHQGPNDFLYSVFLIFGPNFLEVGGKSMGAAGGSMPVYKGGL